MNKRILDHPIFGKLEERKQVPFTFNNKVYQGLENEPIAAALLAHGVRTLRFHEESGSPRAIYCNIGHCYECRVNVDGKQGKRACLTPIKEGMIIESGRQLCTSVKDWRPKDE